MERGEVLDEVEVVVDIILYMCRETIPDYRLALQRPLCDGVHRSVEPKSHSVSREMVQVQCPISRQTKT